MKNLLNADGLGLFTVLVRQLVLGAPPKLITAAIITSGIFSHLASEVGYVILIPLGAIIFHALGRHPMAVFAAAFAGVCAVFGSNFLIGSVDPILAGLSTSAAQIIDPEMNINPMVNYYFMVASTVMVIFVGTWTIIPENGLFRDPETGGILQSPFFTGIIVGLLLLFFVPGMIYGIIVKTIKNDKDVVKHMTNSMKRMGGYIVLVFFASQFIYWFNYSNLGLVVTIDGAEFLNHIGFTGIPLILTFLVLCAFLNIFMGGASAKWPIMAPVFVPMFMILVYHPGFTQTAFCIGYSVTNVITPLMSYFAIIVTYAQNYDEKNGIGTIISLMIPYTVIFMIAWAIMITIWMLLGIPVGIEGLIHMPAM